MIKKLKPALMVFEGFKFANAKKYVKLSKGLPKSRKKSIKDIMRALPLSGETDKMFADILTLKMIFKESPSSFLNYKAIRINRNGEQKFIRLSRDNIDSQTILSPEELIKKIRDFWIRPVENIYTKNGKYDDSRIEFEKFNSHCHRLQMEGEKYLLDGEPCNQEEIVRFLNSLPNYMIVMDYPKSAMDIKARYKEETSVFYIDILNASGTNPEIISENEDMAKDFRNVAAREFALYVANKFPELEYFRVMYVITENSYKVLQIDTGMNLIYDKDIKLPIKEYLQYKQKEIKNREKTKLEILKKYAISAYAKKRGFVNFMYENWKRGLKEDNKFDGTTKAEKKWAHERGFYSYRIKQYGLTEENYKEFLSDMEYKRLRPLNSKFEKWFWDKLFAYFILDGICEYMPEYYYRSFNSYGKTMFAGFQVGEMPDEGDKRVEMGFHDVEDVISFIRNIGEIVLKPSIGSHGNGFFKVEYVCSVDEFLVNEEIYEERKLKEFLLSLKQGYILSEHISACDDLQRVYPSVTPTIRIMVIAEDEPKVQHAYLRIGTENTGNTDNVNAGGIAANIDVNSGKIENPEILMNHVFTSCKRHPDTGEVLPAKIPNWNMVKQGVTDVAKKLGVIEYMGFDVVVTDESFKILEINMHQDLHKYPTYPDEVKKYFACRLAENVNRKI